MLAVCLQRASSVPAAILPVIGVTLLELSLGVLLGCSGSGHELRSSPEHVWRTMKVHWEAFNLKLDSIQQREAIFKEGSRWIPKQKDGSVYSK